MVSIYRARRIRCLSSMRSYKRRSAAPYPCWISWRIIETIVIPRGHQHVQMCQMSSMMSTGKRNTMKHPPFTGNETPLGRRLDPAGDHRRWHLHLCGNVPRRVQASVEVADPGPQQVTTLPKHLKHWWETCWRMLVLKIFNLAAANYLGKLGNNMREHLQNKLGNYQTTSDQSSRPRSNANLC